ncbi:hypothetical protein D3C78_1923410 [compost metagenome]
MSSYFTNWAATAVTASEAGKASMTLWATQRGFSRPSPSITQSLMICQPPARASTAATV